MERQQVLLNSFFHICCHENQKRSQYVIKKHVSKIRYCCFIVDSNGLIISYYRSGMNLCAKRMFHNGLITLNFFRKNILYSIFFWIGCIRMESIKNAINGDMKMVIVIFTISFQFDYFFYFCFCPFLQSSILKLFNDSTYQ